LEKQQQQVEQSQRISITRTPSNNVITVEVIDTVKAGDNFNKVQQVSFNLLDESRVIDNQLNILLSTLNSMINNLSSEEENVDATSNGVDTDANERLNAVIKEE